MELIASSPELESSSLIILFSAPSTIFITHTVSPWIIIAISDHFSPHLLHFLQFSPISSSSFRVRLSPPLSVELGMMGGEKRGEGGRVMMMRWGNEFLLFSYYYPKTPPENSTSITEKKDLGRQPMELTAKMKWNQESYQEVKLGKPTNHSLISTFSFKLSLARLTFILSWIAGKSNQTPNYNIFQGSSWLHNP